VAVHSTDYEYEYEYERKPWLTAAKMLTKAAPWRRM